MRFSTAVAAAGLAASASAAAINGTSAAGDVWVTEVVTAYTTYCPAATSFALGGTTYTVSEATTLTITNCPCTLTHSSTPATSVPVAPYPTSNATITTAYSSGAVVPTGSATGSSSTATTTPFTGAASKAYAAGAGIFAIFGLVAAL